MNYIFHIRNWNVRFFDELEEIITQHDAAATIVRLSMQLTTVQVLREQNKTVTYLPDVFLQKSEDCNEYIELQLDMFMNENFGYGVEFIYELERFKPKPTEKEKFVGGHIAALMELLPNNARMISLTCDHFVYIISAYINKLKGGTNYFIQPIGFPINAQIILETPWDLNFYKSCGNDHLPLDQYLNSLEKTPQESIHYMKPQRNITLWSSFVNRLSEEVKLKRDRTIFTYLDRSAKNIIPDRIKRRRGNLKQVNYISVNELGVLASKKNVFYYPLQYEPEMSILVYSPWYKNQLDIIRLVCQSLKNGDVLLLKENPKMLGSRDQLFYKSIEMFRNVLWADPSLNSREIIRNSFKVISITGTASIEAACMGINSIVFGYPPFWKLLIEEPISDQKISSLITILYRKYSSDEIIAKVKKMWPEFNRAIFQGNLIPHYIDNNFTIADSKSISKQFADQVLLKS